MSMKIYFLSEFSCRFYTLSNRTKLAAVSRVCLITFLPTTRTHVYRKFSVFFCFPLTGSSYLFIRNRDIGFSIAIFWLLSSWKYSEKCVKIKWPIMCIVKWIFMYIKSAAFGYIYIQIFYKRKSRKGVKH